MSELTIATSPSFAAATVPNPSNELLKEKTIGAGSAENKSLDSSGSKPPIFLFCISEIGRIPSISNRSTLFFLTSLLLRILMVETYRLRVISKNSDLLALAEARNRTPLI